MGKYLASMLLEKCLWPKEVLIMILMELNSQGDTETLIPLIDWLGVAVARDEADKASASPVACTSSPAEVPFMDLKLVHNQTPNVNKDLPASWNATTATEQRKRPNWGTVKRLVWSFYMDIN
jgi:hypothetical protein